MKYLVISKRYINKVHFLESINKALSTLIEGECKFHLLEDTKLFFNTESSQYNNIFFSSAFLKLCGYSNTQLSLKPYINSEKYKDRYFISSYFSGFWGDNDYCKQYDPPTFLDIFCPNIDDSIHNFNSNTCTKLCTINNTSNNFDLVCNYDHSHWFRVNKFQRDILHLSIGDSSSTNYKIENNLQGKVDSVIIHLEISENCDLSIPKMIFCDLSYNSERNKSHYTYLTKTSEPISLLKGQEIGLSSIRIPTFKTIFGEHKKIRLCVISPDRIIEKEFKLGKTNFHSVNQLSEYLNIFLQIYHISCIVTNGFLKIVNNSEKNRITISTTKYLMYIFGSDKSLELCSINIHPQSEYIFHNPCDLLALTPKVLALHISFLCNLSVKDHIKENSHIIFFDTNQADQVFNFENTYKHLPGLFNYIQLDILNPLNFEYEFNNDQIHCSIILKTV